MASIRCFDYAVNDISYIARHSESNEESPYAHPSSRFSRSYGDSSVEDSFRMTAYDYNNLLCLSTYVSQNKERIPIDVGILSLALKLYFFI